MKAFPVLQFLAGASFFSFGLVPTSSAQLFYHVVDTDSEFVDSNNNLGVAVDVTFNFAINSGVGTLTLTLENLAGELNLDTPLNLTDRYTLGTLTGFGFDLADGLSYVSGPLTFTQTPNVSFLLSIPFTETHPEGTFDFGASAESPAPQNGLQAGNTATFTFTFQGATAANFSEATFFANNPGPDFGFRYLEVGPRGQGSDKFVYDTDPIPEPSTYGLFAAAALIGLVVLKRSKKKSV